MDFKKADELLEICESKGMSISEVMKRRECDKFETTEDEIIYKMQNVWSIMKESSKNPTKNAVKSMGGLIGGEAKKLNEHRIKGKSIVGNLVSKAITYSMAVLEVNASMGLIVAAPTAGSSGVVPGVILALQEEYKISDDRIIDALFNASAIGYLAMQNARMQLQRCL